MRTSTTADPLLWNKIRNELNELRILLKEQILNKELQMCKKLKSKPLGCLIVSPPSTENLKIDPFVHVDRELAKEVREDSDDEDEAVAATA